LFVNSGDHASAFAVLFLMEFTGMALHVAAREDVFDAFQMD